MTVSIPFMITKKMEADLKAMGYTDEDLRTMTPATAYLLINGPEVEEESAPPAAAPAPDPAPAAAAPSVAGLDLSEAFEDLVALAEEPAPDNLQAPIEEALLAGLLGAPDTVGPILTQARPHDFYFADYRRLAKVFFGLLAEGKLIDRVTVEAALTTEDGKKAKDADKAQAREKLLTIFAQAQARAREADLPQLVDSYLPIFKAKAEVNLAKHTALKVAEELEDGEITPAEAVARIYKVADETEAGRRLSGGLQSEAEDWPGYFADLEAKQDPTRKIRGLKTGLTDLDKLISGLNEGLFVMAAPPGTGKTSLAKQLADEVIRLNDRAAVLFVSLEQSRAELRAKSLARLAEVPSDFILLSNFDTGSRPWQKIKEAAAQYEAQSAGRLFILEGDAKTTPDKIRLAARQVKRETYADQVFVIVDYLQIVPTEAEFKDQRARVEFVVSELRRLARDLKSPVLAISSVARDNYDAKTPTLAVFKESGGVEFSADVAAHIVFKDEAGDKGTRDIENMKVDWRRLTLGIVKQRNGKTGEVTLIFIPALGLFYEEESRHVDLANV